jgi:hypothetical protein
MSSYIGLSVVILMLVVDFNWTGRTWFYKNIRFLDVVYRTAWRLVKCRIPNPKVSQLGHKYKFFTFPKFSVILQWKSRSFGYYFCNGYIRFTSSQVLAGAKLASATIDGLNIQTFIVMGVIPWPILPLED